MKKLFFALCLTAMGLACHAPGASMNDSSCTDKDCADCTKAKMEACSDCTDMPECKAEGTVCPVTGKSMN